MPPKNPKYNLKLKFRRMFEVGIALAILLMIFAFRFFPRIESEFATENFEREDITTVDIEVTIQDVKPPVPPKPVIPIEAPADEDLEDIPIETTDLDENKIINSEPPEYVDEEEDVTPIVFVAVEKMPAPIGGIQAIQEKIVYPEIALKAGIQGRVIVQAVVDKNGNVIDAKVAKGIGAGCDEEAIKAVLATNFSPGEQRGKRVRVQVAVPIFFKINNN